MLQIDKRDKGTPDDWVPRHPELIRLTGRWALTGDCWLVVQTGINCSLS